MPPGSKRNNDTKGEPGGSPLQPHPNGLFLQLFQHVVEEVGGKNTYFRNGKKPFLSSCFKMERSK